MKAEFITHVCDEPVSYVQASFSINGKMLMFRQLLKSPDVDVLQEAWVKLLAEVREVCDASNS